MNHYEGVPNKKRKVYADPSGDLYPLGFKLSTQDRSLLAASGTLDGSGILSVTGTQFVLGSIVVATYHEASAGTAPLAVVVNVGSADFRGDATKGFYYVVLNDVLGG